ncbi:MAG: ABC transporter substrate-binding protein [Gammaproteobacteria bacterium]
MHIGTGKLVSQIARLLCAAALCFTAGYASVQAAEIGVSETSIRFGGVLDLEGLSSGLGRGMKAGIEAAFAGQLIRNRSLEYLTLNDFYNPATTVEATHQLVAEGVFAMVGNVGTSTAAKSLPILARKGVPAVGFFTGADLLRPGVGDIINYRASYVQETASIIRAAVDNGVPASGVCAFVQNDAYGMAGVTGIKLALSELSGTAGVVDKLDEILDMRGDNAPRNGLGPVGFYARNTVRAREGYDSLKAWERSAGAACKVVVTVGVYPAIANFAGYARHKKEDWIISAVSFTGAEDLRSALQDFRADANVLMTQVVPPLDSLLPIVAQAKTALGDAFGYVSLEGYIVGRLVVEALERIEGEITREAFLDTMRGQAFDIGGLALDFSDDNQGSDLVQVTYLSESGYVSASRRGLRRIFRQ